jgi:nucleoside-diphosphate-sugar epimerase
MGIEEKAVGEAFNLGSGKDHRVVDMANIVNQLTGNSAGIKFTERRDWDVKTKLLSSINKANRVLGYQPKMKFEDGIKEVHRWFADNWEHINKSAEF